MMRNRRATARWRVAKAEGAVLRWETDTLAVEEPLEIRLRPPGRPALPVAVTMRTPGHDFELAAGFLFAEGILEHPWQVERITYCTDPEVDGEQRYHIVHVWLRDPGISAGRTASRPFYASSGCGVCGKESIDAVLSRVGRSRVDPGDGLVLDPSVVGRLVASLRRAQPVFDRTGGLHAAGLFTASGDPVAVREDVGRHNAVDKLIGQAFLEGRVPLAGHVLAVSGRAGFEIVQKAAAAGIPVLVSVSAPSSLACQAAESFGMTLVGFARGERFNVYAGSHRLGAATPA